VVKYLDSSETSKSTYICDNKGNKIEEVWYNNLNKPSHKFEYLYSK